MSDKSELEQVKELIEQYAMDPLGEGFEALQKLRKLHDEGKIAGAVDSLTNAPELTNMTLPIVERLQKEIYRPEEALSLHRDVGSTPSPKPSPQPVPTLQRILGNDAQADFDSKFQTFRKECAEDPAMRKLFLAVMAKKFMLENNTKQAIDDALNGSGKPDVLGTTKLGPGSNTFGILQGDIAGNLHANLAGDNHTGMQATDATGKKLAAHIQTLAIASKHVNETPALLAKATQPVVTHLENLANTAKSPSALPTTPSPYKK